MKTLQKLLILTLVSILPACDGQLVEFGNDVPSSGNAGASARGGNGGTSGARGGRGGSAGSSGNGQAGDTGVAGEAGQSGTAGEGGQSGNLGNGGEAGIGGEGGDDARGGEAGSGGLGGNGGAAGVAGRGGFGGSAGLGGNAGLGGVGGNAGLGGFGGSAGLGGLGGNAGLGGLGGNAGLGGFSGNAGLGGFSGGGVGGNPVGALTVVRTNPENVDTNVAINKVIEAALSQTMNALTLDDTTFTLEGPGVTPVVGEVDYDALDGTATFTPSSDLLPNTTFRATITTGAQTLLGNSLVSNYEWTFTTGNQAAQTLAQPTITLGAAASFVILASAGITNIPNSLLYGDVGLTPDAGSNIAGLSCPEMMLGTIYVVDQTGPPCAVENPTLLASAKLAAEAAYLNATAVVRGPPTLISGNLNGLTLYPGLYQSGSSIELSPDGRLYLDAQGDSSAVFIIRSATSITTEATSQVVLTKGANASNIYWTAGSSVTLGTSSIMKGTLIASTSLSLLAGANLEGRALNQSAAAEAITLSGNTIRLPAP